MAKIARNGARRDGRLKTRLGEVRAGKPGSAVSAVADGKMR